MNEIHHASTQRTSFLQRNLDFQAIYLNIDYASQSIQMNHFRENIVEAPQTDRGL